MNLFSIVVVFFALIVNSIFLFFNLKKGNVGYSRYFITIFSFGIIHLLSFAIAKRLGTDMLYVSIALPLSLLYGPTLVLLTNREAGTRNSEYDFLHFIPCLLSVVIFLTLVLQPSFRYSYTFDLVIALCVCALLHVLSYLVLLKRRMSTMGISFIKASRLLQYTWYFVLTTLVVASLFLITNAFVGQKDIAIYAAFSILLFVLFLTGLLFLFIVSSRNTQRLLLAEERSNIARLEALKAEEAQQATPKKAPSVTHTFTLAQEIAYRTKINHFIETRAYLDSEVNKEIFSKTYAIPYHMVTPFLKQEFGKGFASFVNHLRLTYAAKQLKDDRQLLTISNLSFVCGFNSRASFYRNFQTEFGCSPSEFRLNKENIAMC